MPAEVAYDFGGGLTRFTIPFVPIGHANNPADSSVPLGFGQERQPGSVAYAFLMGKYEVSERMIERANVEGGLRITKDARTPGRPATMITWIEAARFVNWLNTSSGHSPAYRFNEFGVLELWPGDQAWRLGGENLFRHKDAVFFLPSEDEWYKAAYFDGVSGRYFAFPTGGDQAPEPVPNGTREGTAVYSLSVNLAPANVTSAGGGSRYGTVGQGGNAQEWMESASVGANDLANEARAVRGGSWSTPELNLRSTHRGSWIPTSESRALGFRVAAMPKHRLTLEPGPEGSLRMLFQGHPGWSGRLQKAGELSSGDSWADLAPITTDAHGAATHVVPPDPSGGTRYFRVVGP